MNAVKKLRILCFPILCFLLISCKSGDDLNSANELSSEFYGTFAGTSESVAGDELSERELVVEIEPWEGKGFTVNWATQIYRASGKYKLTDLAINFYPSSQPGVFTAASRIDIFGRPVPYDSFGEDATPYIWAGLQEKTLTVSALYILDGGGHQLHVYERSMVDEGLLLHFERLNNGQKVAEVSALLSRIN